MKRYASTIVLLILAIGLGVWVFVDRRATTDTEREKRANDVFVAWRREDVTKIAIEHVADSIVLERAGEWRMTSPRVARVDPAAVDRLVLDFELATVARRVVPGDDLGFSPPRAHGSITIGKTTHTFALGAPSPRPEGASYFRLDDEPPIVVDKELAAAILQGADTYRDRQLVPYFEGDLASLEVVGGWRIELVDGAFRRDGVFVDRPALDKVWNGLAAIKAEAFPKDGDVPDPKVRLRLAPRNVASPAAELVLGGACPNQPHDVLVLRVAPTREVACAPEAVLEAFRFPPAYLAGPSTLRADEIDELRIDGAGGYEFARKGTGFVMRAPEARDLTARESDAVSDLLERIVAVKGSVTKGGGPFTARGRVRVHAGTREEVVEVGAHELRRVADDARLAVSPRVVTMLSPRKSILRSRVLLGETRPPSFVGLRCGVPQELVDEGDGLRLEKPRNGGAPYETDGAVVDLANALLRGSVDAWVADASDLDGGECTVTIRYPDSKDEDRIRFVSTPEGVYGDVTVEAGPDIPGMFLAPASLFELVHRIYVSRALRLGATHATVTTGASIRQVSPDGLLELAQLSAQRVVDLHPGGFASIAIDAVGDGGARRLRCEPIPRWGEPLLACWIEGVAATYEVPRSSLAAVLASDVARDGGPR